MSLTLVSKSSQKKGRIMAEAASGQPIAAGELREKFSSVRGMTQSLASGLSAEDCMVQSMPDASPVKWHLAHTTWFFETFILTPNLPDYVPLNPEYRNFFNSYYTAVGDRPLREQRGVFSRPSLDEVNAYRRHVDEAMLRLLESEPPKELAELVTLGLNHEQQHQELIVTDMKHGLAANSLRPAFHERNLKSDADDYSVPKLKWFRYLAGIYEIGHDGEGFAFDNEAPRHKTHSQGFQLGSRLMTNAEYLQFMLDDGYRRPELWLSEGWETVRTQGWEAPLYWEKRGEQWWNFTCDGMRQIGLSEPVCHVSYFEADAFARWAECRLATESEWEIAASQVPIVAGNFLDSGNLHPETVSESSADSPQQMFGDVWEWTQSSYSAYPGFKPATGALGEYNGKFMCNQYVLRGGSCATPESHIRASYRNFFAAHARWQFSGIRLAKDV
jgi:ergothioneine biosynthesis protein EgtB